MNISNSTSNPAIQLSESTLTNNKPANSSCSLKSKIIKVSLKTLAVLATACVGAAITAGVAISVAALHPLALTAAIVSGVALTILATALAIYLVTRSSHKNTNNIYTPIPNHPKPEQPPLPASPPLPTSTQNITTMPQVDLSPGQLAEKGVGTNAEVSKTLAEEAIDKFNEMVKGDRVVPISGHEVEDYAFSLLASQNRYALRKLQQRLTKEVGKKVADTIMANWDLIGHDIRNNCEVLDEKRIKDIIAHAKKIKEAADNEDEYKKQLKILKDKLGTGEIPARRMIIHKNFPLLAELVNNESQRDTDLDTLLKEASVKQQLRKGPLFQPSKGEKDIFKRLGLPVDKIDPLKIPEAVSRKMAFILLEGSPFFEKSEEEFIRDVRKHIKKFAIEERLGQMASSNPTSLTEKAKKRASQIQDLIGFRDHIGTRLNRQRKQVVDNLYADLEQITNNKNDALKDFMKAQLQNDVYKNSALVMDTFMKTNNDIVMKSVNGTGSDENYHKDLQTMLKTYKLTETDVIQKALGDSTKNKLPVIFQWYDQWKDHFDVAFSQGFFDSNEALDAGVCFAMCLRLIAIEQKDPSISSSDLSSHIKIEPQDRFIQALYSADDHYIVPNSVLKHAELSDEKYFDQFYANAWGEEGANQVIEALIKSIKNTNQWDPSKGVCSISLKGGTPSDDLKEIESSWGHAFYVRIREKQGIFRFFDPNYGLLSFKNEEELNKCLRQLIKIAYPDALAMGTRSYQTQ